MQSPPRRGFTLIELLVVIAIIAILAAILFPVFAQVREKGRITVCNSNVRQLLLAAHMYAQDYDEILPSDYHVSNSSTTHIALVTKMDPYINNRDIWYCPTVYRVPFPNYHYTPENVAAGNIGYYWWCYSMPPGTVTPGKPDPSTWIDWAFARRFCGNVPRIVTESWPTYCWVVTDVFCKVAGTSHRTGGFCKANIGYLDGHVKFLTAPAKIEWPQEAG